MKEINQTGPKIYPVIHFLNRDVAFEEAQKAIDSGADGIFLISHRGNDAELLSVACSIKVEHPGFPIGVNFLSMEGLDATIAARKSDLPMVWGDDLGVDSTGFTDMGLSIRAQKAVHPNGFDVFASVAFKYRPHEPNPSLAAKNALEAGFIPTTSGSGTGSAPELGKIITMSQATGGMLAVASGMTPENIAAYAPYLSHILVATGIAQDEFRIDVAKLKKLIFNSKQNAKSADAESQFLIRQRKKFKMTNIDRSEAVNLARNIKENDMQPTPKGIRLLINAVLAMDEALSTECKNGAVVLTRSQLPRLKSRSLES